MPKAPWLGQCSREGAWQRGAACNGSMLLLSRHLAQELEAFFLERLAMGSWAWWSSLATVERLRTAQRRSALIEGAALD